MIRLDSLATELILAIIEHLDIPRDFAEVDDYDGPPPFKSFALTCRRFYNICFPLIYRSLRLYLKPGDALRDIQQLRSFLQQHDLASSVDRLALGFHHKWNDGKMGLELKKFVWELSNVKALSLQKERGFSGLSEKSAKWSYYLNSIERIQLRMMDDDNELKMLFLRESRATYVHCDDGNFRTAYEDGGGWHIGAWVKPRLGISLLKPSSFPHLKKLVYSAAWSPNERFKDLLAFAVKLPVLQHFAVTLMGGEDEDLRLGRLRYGQSEEDLRYRAIVMAYRYLSSSVEKMKSLEYLVIGDRHVPYYHGDAQPPILFDLMAPGTYRRMRGADSGGEVQDEVQDSVSLRH